MALRVLEQADFSGGMWRAGEPQVAPANTAWDIINGLLDDQGSIYRRGGSRYINAPVDGNSLRGISSMLLSAGPRTMTWNSGAFFTLDGSQALTAIGVPGGLAFPSPLAIPAGISGLAIFPTGTSATLFGYGGSMKANYSTGTVTVTNGSATVTGAGTSWLAGADAGQFFVVGGFLRMVSRVDSDTQLTLAGNWHGPTAAGSAYQLNASYPVGFPAGGIPTCVTTVGSPQKLVVCSGSVVSFSPVGDIYGFISTDTHQLPAQATIIGCSSIGDTAVLFTTDGVYVIRNMAYDLTDDFGNVQHSVGQINKDIVLWANQGLASWHGGFIVPAVDDVYLMAGDGTSQSIGAAIRPLYREYVRAGYVPGAATVYRGHYVLPILSTTGVTATPYQVRDVLVCRVDSGVAWSRWDNTPTYAVTQRFEANARTPSLIGTSVGRLADYSGCFEPSVSNQADANGEHTLYLTTRDFSLRRQAQAFWKFARLRYELSGGSMAAFKATGPAGASFTTLSGSAVPDDGTNPFEWVVDERSQAVRLRLQTGSSMANARLRSLELHVREGAKR